MDLAKILANVEGKDELIKQIEAEVGREYVPRTDFNAKNNELKEAQRQLGDMTTNFNTLSNEKKTWDTTVADLNEKISGYEKSALKTKVAHEEGLPYELANRLIGDDEASLRADAKSLSALVTTKQPLPPQQSKDKKLAEGEDAPYKELLSSIKGE